jgi:hypothetical protein
MMGFLEPDAAPDAFGLEWRWQPAEPFSQLANLDLQALVNRRARRATFADGSRFVRLCDGSTVPNTLTKVFGLRDSICTELFRDRAITSDHRLLHCRYVSCVTRALPQRETSVGGNPHDRLATLRSSRFRCIRTETR